MKKALHILILLLAFQATAQNEKIFEQANALYNKGEFTKAIDRYSAILSSDKHSAELYYNIANAHYKLNHIAPSIYNYEKALALKPNDEDIKNNLAFANNMRVDAIETLPGVGISRFIKRATTSLSLNNWAKVTVALVMLFVVLYLFYYFAFGTQKKRAFFVSSTLSIILACIALAFTFHNYSLVKKNNPAIVFATETKIKEEPNLSSTEVIILHEGTKVQVLETSKNWNKIKLTDGKTGWLQSKDVKLLSAF